VGRLAGLQPSLIVGWFENDRHSVVNPFRQFIRISGDDGEGFEILARRLVFPCLPQAGEGEERPTLKSDCVWLLGLGVGLVSFDIGFLPLVKPIGGDETATSLEGLTECGAGGDGLRSGVDGGVAGFSVFGPARDKPPAHDGELSLACVRSEPWAEPDHWLPALRGHVV